MYISIVVYIVDIVALLKRTKRDGVFPQWSLSRNASSVQLASLHLASRFTDELTLAAPRITPTEKKERALHSRFRKIRQRPVEK